MNGTHAGPPAAPPARSRAMRLAGAGYLIIFALLMLAKLVLPRGAGGWSQPPTFDLLALLGWGICTLVMAGSYLYAAWTKDAAQYIDWFLRQAGTGAKWQADLVRSLPRLTLWQVRILSPLAVILGGVMIAFSLYSLVFGLPSP